MELKYILKSFIEELEERIGTFEQKDETLDEVTTSFTIYNLEADYEFVFCILAEMTGDYAGEYEIQTIVEPLEDEFVITLTIIDGE